MSKPRRTWELSNSSRVIVSSGGTNMQIREWDPKPRILIYFSNLWLDGTLKSSPLPVWCFIFLWHSCKVVSSPCWNIASNCHNCLLSFNSSSTSALYQINCYQKIFVIISPVFKQLTFLNKVTMITSNILNSLYTSYSYSSVHNFCPKSYFCGCPHRDNMLFPPF